ncbi:MAG: cupin domain-containing protein [Halobacteriaceae archaeon]
MGYHVLDPEALDDSPTFPCDRRSLSDAAGLEALHAAVYEVAPGESLARGYHYHRRREELFWVLSGRLSVDTPERVYEVPAGRAFVAEPESPIDPHNPADAADPARVLGAGAPASDPGLPYGAGGDGTGGE